MCFQSSFSKILAPRPFFSIFLAGLAVAMPALFLLAQGQAAGPTPHDLFAAVKSGDVAVLKQLITDGADVNAADADGLTPLHLAALRGDSSAAETLLEAGAKVEVSDKVGMTPLHAAAFNGHKDVVALLLAHGASANPQDKAGMTPLHYAAAGGHDDVVQALLAAAASPAAVSAEGHTPADLAEQNGNPGLAAKLRAAHAPSASSQAGQAAAKAAKTPRLITNEDLPNGGTGGGSTSTGPQAVPGEPRRGAAPSGPRQRQGATQGGHAEQINELYAQIEKLSRERQDLENQVPDLRRRCEGVKDSQKQGQSNIQAGPGIVASEQSVQSTRRAEVESQVACRPLRQAESKIQTITQQIARLQERISGLEMGSSKPAAAPQTRQPAARPPSGGP